MPKASIIIPNWNGKHHLEVCLNALRQQSMTDFEVLLVDNGSEDGSQTYVREMFPEVILIENGENLGFTGACIKGYEASSGEFVVLLNNDTEATSDWLEKLLSGFDLHPDVGSTIGKILLFDEATSALDNRTQDIVMRSLDGLNITRIIIAHRLSTVKRADRILVMDRGQIIQSGTFDELASQLGLFQSLMARQAGRFLPSIVCTFS